MPSPVALFSDIGPILLHYKNASTPVRKKQLQASMAQLHQLPATTNTKDEAKNHYKTAVYAATLIRYAEILQRMENQHYFDILPDFHAMDLGAELSNWFAFGEPTQMRLKKPLAAYTTDIWIKFRQAQQAHLKKQGKESAFALEELDIHHPPANQLYPVQIQMLGRLYNEAVDRISLNAKGEIRFARRFGFYLLPGGGMVTTNAASQLDTLGRKMLEEHLEEEHANLYSKAAPFYDQLDKSAFSHCLLAALNTPQAQSLPAALQNMLQEIIRNEPENASCLQQIITIIDAKTHTIYNKALQELRAILQVQSFALTPLFAKALDYIKTHSKCVIIQQYLDTRAVGGFQHSHTFLFNQPLDEWFKHQFKGVEGEFGDDISGAEMERLNLLQSIARFQHIKYSHLLIGLAAYHDALDNQRVQINSIWDKDQFEAARSALVLAATVQLNS